MNRNEHSLVILMEECAEVSQRASKQLRFGQHEVQPGQHLTNHERLRTEILDMLACVRLLIERDQIRDITIPDIDVHFAVKQAKILRMLELSRAQGCVSDQVSEVSK